MCGISGILSTSKISVKSLVAMNDLICHRGPDDEGYVLFSRDDNKEYIYGGRDTPADVYSSSITYCPKNNIINDIDDGIGIALGMAHRRLGIVDLSENGHQPMSYAEGRYWIVFNGEIYNYREMKVELEGFGFKFSSCTDTEVILAAYAFWGQECLSRFNGMWSIAIYDRKLKKLFLARDRFGIKPLYYWFAPDGAFCFGSEIKQFTSYPGWEPILNRRRAIDYLARGLSDHTDETLFDGVFQVRPSHYAIIDQSVCDNDSNRIPTTQWFKFSNNDLDQSFETCVNEFRDKLNDSIKLHLRSDVPVGSCLSGGLDSSSIVSIANIQLQQISTASPLKTFSACSVEERFDERKWIRALKEHAKNLECHYIFPSLDQLFVDLPLITWHQDEPFASTSIYAQWNVFRLASENGIKVMLDGQGADEQLAGYFEYFALRFGSLFYEGNWLNLFHELSLIKKLHHFSNRYILKLLLSGIIPPAYKYLIKKVLSFHNCSHPDWLNGANMGEEFSFLHIKKTTKRQSIREFSEQQLTSTNLQMLLHWEDRNSMAHSVESRVPFLDHRLVDFVLAIPDQFKISNGVTKRVLRAAMKNILPSIICNRMDKMGFVTSEESWVTHDDPDLFRSKVKSVPDASCGLINENIFIDLEKMIAGDKKFDFRIWRAICFSEWVKCFNVKSR